LDEQPENLDVMVSLATVYEEQGKEEQALDLVEYGMLIIFLSNTVAV
jgi:thioredoxin-like negative regulator of GroEL